MGVVHPEGRKRLHTQVLRRVNDHPWRVKARLDQVLEVPPPAPTPRGLELSGRFYSVLVETLSDLRVIRQLMGISDGPDEGAHMSAYQRSEQLFQVGLGPPEPP